jgi:hypothetical protein
MELSMRLSAAAAALVVAVSLPPSHARAASGGTPITIAQSGYLLDVSDNPLSSAVTLRFRVFDAPTLGAVQWEGTCAGVQPQSGYYAVALGSASCTGSSAGGLDPVLDTSDLPPGQARWLEVEVANVVLLPRLALHTTASALVAARALTADLLGTKSAADFAGVVHEHALADVTGLEGALAGKAAATHGHVIDDVAGLQAALDTAARIPTGALPGTPGAAGSIWFGDDRMLYVSDGAAWTQIGSGTQVGGPAGTDCATLRAQGKPSGAYTLDPNGGDAADAFTGWCDMATEGGAWMMLMNLESQDSTLHAFGDTNFWLGATTEGTAANAYTAGFKSAATVNTGEYDQIMIYMHNNGLFLGYAIYDVLPQYRNTPWYTLMGSTSNTMITGARVMQSGASGANTNCCTTNRTGDPFVDAQNGEPLVLNQQANANGPWGLDTLTSVRITTTAGSGNWTYAHTMAGLGGHHERPAGSYVTNFESSPIMAYCNPTVAYGGTGNISGGAVGSGSGTCNASPTYLPRDIAVLVRKASATSSAPGSLAAPGLSCKDLLDRGVGQSGVYWIRPGGTGDAFQAYCNMVEASGGWTLLINLKSNSQTQHYWGDTGFWTGTAPEGSVARPFLQGFKSEAFSRLAFSEVMVAMHNAGALVAYGVYDVLPSYRTQPLQQLLSTVSNTVLTGTRKAQWGSSGVSGNCCTQTRTGDLFVDAANSEPIVLNQQYNAGGAWGTDTLTRNRIATTAGVGNNTYPHTLAGLGGQHARSGDWASEYQSSPIMSYCPSGYAYGSGANVKGDPWTSRCGNTPTWIARDHAIYVR